MKNMIQKSLTKAVMILRMDLMKQAILQKRILRILPAMMGPIPKIHLRILKIQKTLLQMSLPMIQLLTVLRILKQQMIPEVTPPILMLPVPVRANIWGTSC